MLLLMLTLTWEVGCSRGSWLVQVRQGDTACLDHSRVDNYIMTCHQLYFCWRWRCCGQRLVVGCVHVHVGGLVEWVGGMRSHFVRPVHPPGCVEVNHDQALLGQQ